MLLPLRHQVILSVFLILGLVFTEFLRANESDTDTDDMMYRVKEVEFDVGGRTQDRVINRLAQFYPGQEFGSQAELDLYLADRVQELLNQRPLAEASIEYVLGRPENNIIPVTVFVQTRDSWNILVLPYFRYDSNDGLLLSLRGRDYNFFGTLERLAVTLDWENRDLGQAPEDEDAKDNELTLELEFLLPFTWQGYDWSWELKSAMAFTGTYEEYGAETRIALDLPGAFDRIWTLGLEQEYFYTTEDEDEDGYYLGTELDYGTRFQLPVELPGFGQLSYSPRVAVGQKYRVLEEISADRRGTLLTFAHQIGAGSINWIGNFREGSEFLLENSNTFNAQSLDWERDITTEVRGYAQNFPFAVSGRTGAFANFDDKDQVAVTVPSTRMRTGNLDQALRYSASRFLPAHSTFVVRLDSIYAVYWKICRFPGGANARYSLVLITITEAGEVSEVSNN
ncbi:MAG: hypothetical protein LC641_08055 [Spirochaeta sp.]|nr:hypothetical protein [Spirochaeta sp.]